jgi:hypothetical protein
MSRTLRVLAVAIVATTFGSSQSAAQAGPSAERRLVDRWVAAWNSYDLREVDSLFLGDDRVTYFSSEREGVIRGISALRAHHEGFGFVAGGKAAVNKLWLEGVQEDKLPGGATVVTAIWFFSRATDPTNPQKGPVTMVLMDTPRGPRVAHMHFANYLPRPPRPEN